MAHYKNYTDIEQSKKLAYILSLDSSDGWWTALNWQETEYYIEVKQDGINKPKKYIPCWSFTALFNILPDGTDIMKDKTDTENEKYMCSVGVKGEVLYTFGSNPIDVCYEMVLRLHELKML